jgi:hypothetical protein
LAGDCRQSDDTFGDPNVSSVNDAGQELHFAAPVDATGLHRKIGWAGAFWVASGVPALVLFSIGSIAATVGKPSWIIWAISICFGFIQSFSYAEIAGLFPHKSGGASVGALQQAARAALRVV